MTAKLTRRPRQGREVVERAVLTDWKVYGIWHSIIRYSIIYANQKSNQNQGSTLYTWYTTVHPLPTPHDTFYIITFITAVTYVVYMLKHVIIIKVGTKTLF